jgi:hypothetical protein
MRQVPDAVTSILVTEPGREDESKDGANRLAMNVGVGVGAALGIAIGTAVFAATGDAFWIAVGPGFGVAFAAAFGSVKRD